MLVDLTVYERFKEITDGFINKPGNPHSQFAIERSIYNPVNHLHTGVYLDQLSEFSYAFVETRDEYCSYHKDYIVNFGVADNVDQILRRYKNLVEDKEHKYFIILDKIVQEKSNEFSSGWKWENYGEYIGDFKPRCIYFDDEDFGPDFQGFVYTYQIYKLS